jgi:hypothetical protein
MNPFRILLVDNAPDRKERIYLLKANGLAVSPALDVEQAHERCKPGRYDVIIVHAGAHPEVALSLCDGITNKYQKQLVLLMVTPDTQVPGRSYLVSDRPQALLGRVKTLLTPNSNLVPMPGVLSGNNAELGEGFEPQRRL